MRHKKLISFALPVAMILILNGVNIMNLYGGTVHWEYHGPHGPDHWGELDPAFETCATGTSQSPIDFTSNGITQYGFSEGLDISYSSSPVELKNNGHTVVFSYQPGSFINFNGKTFELLQFHFHARSEHTINGRHTALEAHLVHKASDGQLLVIGVLFDLGSPNQFVSKFWDNLPTEHLTFSSSNTVNVEDLVLDQAGYLAYSGSLTTPPCSEGVQWIGLNQIQPVSADQFNAYFNLFGEDTYRPTQPLNGRDVTFYFKTES